MHIRKGTTVTKSEPLLFICKQWWILGRDGGSEAQKMPFCHEWGNTIQTTTGKLSAFVIRLLTVNCSITIAVPYTPTQRSCFWIHV